MVINTKLLKGYKEVNEQRITIIQECKVHHKVYELYIDPKNLNVKEIKECLQSSDKNWKERIINFTVFLLTFNSNSRSTIKEITFEVSYLFHFCTTLKSWTKSLKSSLIPTTITTTLFQTHTHPHYHYPSYHPSKSSSFDNFCILPKYQLLKNEWLEYHYYHPTLDVDSIYSSLISHVVCDRHESQDMTVQGKEFKEIPDFSEIFRKLDRIQGSLNQLDSTYHSIANKLTVSKENNKRMNGILEEFSLEIYSLYKKLKRLEERLFYTVKAKANALDYQYKKSLEREERILKVLYDHMSQLYTTQIEFIQQVNSLLPFVETPQRHGMSEAYIKQKYFLLCQQMNKYKMMLTAFELPLNLLIHKESMPYFEDFLQFLGKESQTLKDYIHTLNWKDPSLAHFNKKNQCVWKSPVEHLVEDIHCPLNPPPPSPSPNHSTMPPLNFQENIFYKLYQIYHERLLKLKQENYQRNKTNHQFFDEMKRMRHQLDNVQSIIEMLGSNQQKLENKFRSIEQLLKLSPVSKNNKKNNSSHSFPLIVSHIPSSQVQFICMNTSPDFDNVSSSSSSNASYQCPVFNNEFVDLVYQYVMKKIQETDHGVDQPDYALKSSGGFIVYPLTSPSYQGGEEKKEDDHHYHDSLDHHLIKDKESTFASSNPLFRNQPSSFFKVLLSKYFLPAGFSFYSSPELVLDPHILPGYGWIMNGSSGYITIGLAKPIYPKSITIDHIPSNLDLENTMSSAPRYIEVLGIYDINQFKLYSHLPGNTKKITRMNHQEHENEITLIPLFEFNPSTSSSITPTTNSLTIPIPENIYVKIRKPISYLHVKILSNWGNQKYTCIYRIRVH
ncbi:hypothetical protein BCR36DRAFT_415207 [Piromyces finnis]|uniref:SUN domain-containing protein n=1 Tax=Piromyces finnis TaxID=1754191 RepID=A0A1Y1UZZ0_9FUNG|nr:hypothetical protein BCR36DRAFT_415207 [Piromyces finnis]|eukprot:ORX44175.1 hypothetical protein BCR36DRAFT_415207 [Piromyces finnis]